METEAKRNAKRSKGFLSDFLLRGLVSSVGGPLVLAVVYLILDKTGAVGDLPVSTVVLGIFTSALLAFVAGGIPAIYNVESLPTVTAALIHLAVLYADYLVIYLINGWLGREKILIFTLFFALGYAAVWAIIYFTAVRRAKKMSAALNAGQPRTKCPSEHSAVK